MTTAGLVVLAFGRVGLTVGSGRTPAEVGVVPTELKWKVGAVGRLGEVGAAAAAAADADGAAPSHRSRGEPNGCVFAIGGRSREEKQNGSRQEVQLRFPLHRIR